MITARALMPVDQDTRKRFSIRHSSLGILANAVKVQGVRLDDYFDHLSLHHERSGLRRITLLSQQWQFIPRHVFPPLLANTVIGTVLYTTYIATLSTLHPASSIQKHRTYSPPPFSSVFMAGIYMLGYGSDSFTWSSFGLSPPIRLYFFFLACNISQQITDETLC